jgi:hypothetical protein
VAPGFAFGLAHAGYLSQGILVWLGIMLPTMFLGYDLGCSISPGTPKFGSDHGRALFERRDGVAVDCVLHGNRTLALGSEIER